MEDNNSSLQETDGKAALVRNPIDEWFAAAFTPIVTDPITELENKLKAVEAENRELRQTLQALKGAMNKGYIIQPIINHSIVNYILDGGNISFDKQITIDK